MSYFVWKKRGEEEEEEGVGMERDAWLKQGSAPPSIRALRELSKTAPSELNYVMQRMK